MRVRNGQTGVVRNTTSYYAVVRLERMLVFVSSLSAVPLTLQQSQYRGARVLQHATSPPCLSAVQHPTSVRRVSMHLPMFFLHTLSCTPPTVLQQHSRLPRHPSRHCGHPHRAAPCRHSAQLTSELLESAAQAATKAAAHRRPSAVTSIARRAVAAAHQSPFLRSWTRLH